VVIDDHPLFRRGLADLIAMHDALHLVGAAASGEEGLTLVAEHNPDMVLLDLNMRGMDGLATLQAIKASGSEARVIMLTVSDSEEDVVAALRGGADGYLLKDMEPEEILGQLIDAAGGRLAISPRLTELLARALRQEQPPRDQESAQLTDRERQILQLISTGKSNKMIARALDITEGTVKVHVKNLLKKLNLRSRVEAAVWSIEHLRAGDA
jgi:two-component system nitrate/nitrite response regulator NarL